jgi:hypothetical protein
MYEFIMDIRKLVIISLFSINISENWLLFPYLALTYQKICYYFPI